MKIISVSDDLIAKRRFALGDQLVRSAVSVASNIAEGQGRSTTRDRRHYLIQARGSLYELETQLEIVTRARLIDELPGVPVMLKQISAGLTKMINALAVPPPRKSAP